MIRCPARSNLLAEGVSHKWDWLVPNFQACERDAVGLVIINKATNSYICL